jgi:1-acyl-sn-glycerol-3-phosphate acyltransferase
MVFQKSYAVWAIFTLVFTGVIISLLLIPGMVIPARSTRLKYNQSLLMAWSAIWGFLAFLRFVSRDRPEKAPIEPTIFIANHGSYLDPPAAYLNIHQPFRTLAKKELTKIPFYARIVKSSCILIDRKDDASRKEGVDAMKEALELGESILIYPEGSQNRTQNPLKDFYDGAFRLAIETGKPIQVIATINASSLLPAEKMGNIRPGTVKMFWLEKIETKDLTLEDLPDLKQRIQTMLEQKIIREDEKFKSLRAID